MLRAAKETISLAEQRLLEDDKRQFDSAWQEMLNHATQRVIETQGCLSHRLSLPCSVFFFEIQCKFVKHSIFSILVQTYDL